MVKSFDDLTLDNPEHQELFKSAIGKARRWFYNKRGVEHGPAVRLLVRDVATIYKYATGKKPAQVLPVLLWALLIRHHLKTFYGQRFKWLV